MSTNVSWLKKVGQVIAKVVGVIAKDAKPVADIVAPVAEAMFPQFAPEVAAADGLVTKIAKEAIDAEAIAEAAGQEKAGPAKLNAVLQNVGPAINDWVASAFPGAKQVSEASQAGLVNAIVAIVNEQDGGAVKLG